MSTPNQLERICVWPEDDSHLRGLLLRDSDDCRWTNVQGRWWRQSVEPGEEEEWSEWERPTDGPWAILPPTQKEHHEDQ